jgi:hypothetical protein
MKHEHSSDNADNSKQGNGSMEPLEILSPITMTIKEDHPPPKTGPSLHLMTIQMMAAQWFHRIRNDLQLSSTSIITTNSGEQQNEQGDIDSSLLLTTRSVDPLPHNS